MFLGLLLPIQIVGNGNPVMVKFRWHCTIFKAILVAIILPRGFKSYEQAKSVSIFLALFPYLIPVKRNRF